MDWKNTGSEILVHNSSVEKITGYLIFRPDDLNTCRIKQVDMDKNLGIQ